MIDQGHVPADTRVDRNGPRHLELIQVNGSTWQKNAEGGLIPHRHQAAVRDGRVGCHQEITTHRRSPQVDPIASDQGDIVGRQNSQRPQEIVAGMVQGDVVGRPGRQLGGPAHRQASAVRDGPVGGDGQIPIHHGGTQIQRLAVDDCGARAGRVHRHRSRHRQGSEVDVSSGGGGRKRGARHGHGAPVGDSVPGQHHHVSCGRQFRNFITHPGIRILEGQIVQVGGIEKSHDQSRRGGPVRQAEIPEMEGIEDGHRARKRIGPWEDDVGIRLIEIEIDRPGGDGLPRRLGDRQPGGILHPGKNIQCAASQVDVAQDYLSAGRHRGRSIARGGQGDGSLQVVAGLDRPDRAATARPGRGSGHGDRSHDRDAASGRHIQRSIKRAGVRGGQHHIPRGDDRGGAGGLCRRRGLRDADGNRPGQIYRPSVGRHIEVPVQGDAAHHRHRPVGAGQPCRAGILAIPARDGSQGDVPQIGRRFFGRRHRQGVGGHHRVQVDVPHLTHRHPKSLQAHRPAKGVVDVAQDHRPGRAPAGHRSQGRIEPGVGGHLNRATGTLGDGILRTHHQAPADRLAQICQSRAADPGEIPQTQGPGVAQVHIPVGGHGNHPLEIVQHHVGLRHPVENLVRADIDRLFGNQGGRARNRGAGVATKFKGATPIRRAKRKIAQQALKAGCLGDGGRSVALGPGGNRERDRGIQVIGSGILHIHPLQSQDHRSVRHLGRHSGIPSHQGHPYRTLEAVPGSPVENLDAGDFPVKRA